MAENDYKTGFRDGYEACAEEIQRGGCDASRAPVRRTEGLVCGMKICYCRCGGFPMLHEKGGYDWVSCQSCGTETEAMETERDAVRRWNELQEWPG